MCGVCNDSKDNVVSFAVGAARSWFLREESDFFMNDEPIKPKTDEQIGDDSLETQFGTDHKLKSPLQQKD